jgi:hypothetical protein
LRLTFYKELLASGLWLLAIPRKAFGFWFLASSNAEKSIWLLVAPMKVLVAGNAEKASKP